MSFDNFFAFDFEPLILTLLDGNNAFTAIAEDLKIPRGPLGAATFSTLLKAVF